MFPCIPDEKKALCILFPTLLDTLHTAYDTKQLPATLYDSTMIVIPMPNTDVTKPDTYRQPSLLDADTKLVGKVLANCLAKFTHK